jgi:hypothetical protein
MTSSFLESLPCTACHDFDLSANRNKIASITSGFLFFAGWWFAIDACTSDYMNTRDKFQLCGVFSALSMMMVNSVSNDQIRGEASTGGLCDSGIAAKFWFFFGCLMGFGALLGSAWILFREYVFIADEATFRPKTTYPGVAYFLQNLFIFASSVIYKFGRTEDLW